MRERPLLGIIQTGVLVPGPERERPATGRHWQVEPGLGDSDHGVPVPVPGPVRLDIMGVTSNCKKKTERLGRLADELFGVGIDRLRHAVEESSETRSACSGAGAKLCYEYAVRCGRSNFEVCAPSESAVPSLEDSDDAQPVLGTQGPPELPAYL